MSALKKIYLLTIILLLCFAFRLPAQTINVLREQIQKAIASKQALVGVAITGNSGKDTLSFNAEEHYPMQSVFKFPIALAVLAQLDKGNLSFDQMITIRKEELLPHLYSPIRDKYPEGATLPLKEILAYTVSESDNVGCDVLLQLIGGPEKVDAYFQQNNFKEVSIKWNEATQQSNWDLQFQNWTTPTAANNLLQAFYFNSQKLLSKKSHAFIWQIMKATETGKNRLKGQLPKGTIIAHKTGSSGTNKEGITAAVNDIGIIFLPNGQFYFISVFVTNSKESADSNEKIISDIAKLSWDYFSSKSK